MAEAVFIKLGRDLPASPARGELGIAGTRQELELGKLTTWQPMSTGRREALKGIVFLLDTQSGEQSRS